MSTSPALSPSAITVVDLLAALSDQRAAEAARLVAMMRDATGEEPATWASKIVGFGSYHYRYESGREGTAPLVGFAPSARHHVVYLVGGYQERYPTLVRSLAAAPGMRGAPRLARGCVYLTRFDAVDPAMLRALIDRTVRVHRGMDTEPSPRAEG